MHDPTTQQSKASSAPMSTVQSSSILPRFVKRLEYETLKDDKTQGPERSIFAWSNVALPASYFLVGFSDLLLTPMSVYMVNEMGAEPWQQTTISVISQLPWSFKVLYGFWSDVAPLGGLHRKPYFLLGYVLQTFCFLYLALLAWEGALTFPALASLVFLYTFGQIMADVMADTLVVEHSQATEAGAAKGQVQATCYAVRFLGSILGNLGGTCLYNKQSWGWGMTFWQICLLLGLLPPLLLFPAAPALWERRGKPVRPVPDQVRDIWDMCQQKAVWKPMAFVYLYNIFQVPCAAWQSFLQLGLGFPAWRLGLLSTAGAAMTFVGILAFKKFFFQSSWRALYLWTTALVASFSLAQIALVTRFNATVLHVSDFWFSMGDDVLANYVTGVQWLPVCIMYIQLCPAGSEGASYALLTTYGNVAGAVSSALAGVLAGIWDVTNSAMAAHQYSGLLNLTILTSILGPMPLLILWLLPKSSEEARKLRDSKKKSKLGGFMFLLVLLLSLMYTTWDCLSAMFE